MFPINNWYSFYLLGTFAYNWLDFSGSHDASPSISFYMIPYTSTYFIQVDYKYIRSMMYLILITPFNTGEIIKDSLYLLMIKGKHHSTNKNTLKQELWSQKWRHLP